jgi:ribosomal protein L30/L7E
MIAAVRVRGDVDAPAKVSTTLESLNLTQRNRLVVLEDTDSIRGMLNHAKDFIAFGDISEETEQALEDRKGEQLEAGDTFDLPPPSGGFRGTRQQYGQGGSLGDHGELDHLVGRMV